MSFLRHDLYIEPIDAFIDPVRPQKKAFITHAHADHARAGHETVVATPQTIAIMKSRYGENCAKKFEAVSYHTPYQDGAVTISFHPAGHVLGSAQIRLEYNKEVIVVTGDYKTIPDPSCAAFEIVPCDIFVTEATFGLPVFKHPAPQTQINKLFYSLKINPQRPHLIGAYALGKAQRLIALLRDAGYNKTIYLHGAMVDLCHLYKQEGIDLGVLEKVDARGNEKKERYKGDIIIAPPSALQSSWARGFGDPVLGMASGWMHVKQRAKQRGLELPLILSDHADWNELTQTILKTGAKEIWVTHGREDALIYFCQQHGLTAKPLSIIGRSDDDDEDYLSDRDKKEPA